MGAEEDALAQHRPSLNELDWSRTRSRCSTRRAVPGGRPNAEPGTGAPAAPQGRLDLYMAEFGNVSQSSVGLQRVADVDGCPPTDLRHPRGSRQQRVLRLPFGASRQYFDVARWAGGPCQPGVPGEQRHSQCLSDRYVGGVVDG